MAEERLFELLLAVRLGVPHFCARGDVDCGLLQAQVNLHRMAVALQIYANIACLDGKLIQQAL